jgi:hypothetical protein
MVAVKGIYDGKSIRILDPVDISTPHRVIITFLEEITETPAKDAGDALEPYIGMWADLSAEEERVFHAILEARAHYFTGRQFEPEDKGDAI